MNKYNVMTNMVHWSPLLASFMQLGLQCHQNTLHCNLEIKGWQEKGGGDSKTLIVIAQQWQ